MSINKALKQVMMYEEIGGKKKENPQPTDTTPVKMPEAPRPTGSKPKSTTGVNAPPKRPIPFPFPTDTTREPQPKPIRPGSQPRPIPANGGAEVTPPQGLPESMKAFWKQRLTNQLNEKRQLGVLKGVGKAVGGFILPGIDDLIGKGIDVYDRHVDDEFVRQTHDRHNPDSPYYDPDRDIFRDWPLETRPHQGSDGVYRLPNDVGGGWVGGNSPSGSGGTRTA
jgi:hypothetical protein